MPAGGRTATERTVPAVPTPLVSVELSDLRRRGAPLAVLTSPTEDDSTWFGPGAQWLPDEWRVSIGATGRAGEVWTVPEPLTGSNVIRWLAGVGDRTAVAWRSAGAALIRSIQDFPVPDRQVRSADVALPADIEPAELGAFTLGLRLGGYQLRITGDRSHEHRVRSVRLWLEAPPAEALAAELTRALALSAATALARDLANMPSNVKDPAWLAGVVRRVHTGIDDLTATVRDERWLTEQGFGGVLAVGGGSASPPRLVELAWRPPGSARSPHLVLVGKGVTFDTGGLSLKPAAGMQLMRTDMAGAAAVAAAVRGIAELGLPVRVTGLVPMAENHVSGSAYRPGDIVRHVDGRTTEVSNTDAEGRMLLADAIGYAVRSLRPDLLVDVATLTGAMKVSLGLRTAGFFATDDAVAARLTAAGDTVGESWWRMPLLDAYTDDVTSDIADVRQCPPGPSAVTAALFLREFTGGLPWAHLDIAGPARSDKTYGEVVPGGTGFAARTLIALAESLAGRFPG